MDSSTRGSWTARSSLNPRPALGVLVLGVLALAADVGAQNANDVRGARRWFMLPSFASAGVYEDNLFFTTDEEQASAPFLRLSPGVGAGFRGVRTRLDGAFTFDTEIYPQEYSELSSVFARQDADLRLEHDFDPRSTLATGLRYQLTRRPEEIQQETGLISARRRAQRFDYDVRFTRDVSPRVSATAVYAFGWRSVGRPKNILLRSSGILHTVGATLGLQHAPRSRGSVTFLTQLFVEDEVTAVLPSQNAFLSHVATYGLEHRLTPRATITASVGPRVSEQIEPTSDPTRPFEVRVQLLPEIFAGFQQDFTRSDLALQYSKSQFQAFGFTGFVNTQSLTFSMNRRVTRDLTLSARPGYYRNTRATASTDSFQIEFTAIAQLNDFIGLDVRYGYQTQNGFFNLIDADFVRIDATVTRNTFFFGLRLERLID